MSTFEFITWLLGTITSLGIISFAMWKYGAKPLLNRTIAAAIQPLSVQIAEQAKKQNEFEQRVETTHAKQDAQLTRIDKLCADELTMNGGGSVKAVNMKTHACVTALALLSDECNFQCDSNGAVIKVNRALCRLFNCEPAELEGYKFMRFIKSDQRPQARQNWMDGIKVGLENSDEITIIPKGGDAEVRARYIILISRDRSGNIIAINGKIEIIHH